MASRRRSSKRRSSKRTARRRQRGGQAELDDMSMDIASQANLADGQSFEKFHANQHGGQAPVGYTGVLDSSLVPAARTGPILDSLMDAQAQGPDQAGGARRRKRKAYSLKLLGKNTKAFFGRLVGKKKGRRTRRRKQRGGNAPANGPYTLLPPDLASDALAGQNREMALAQDPKFLAPQGL